MAESEVREGGCHCGAVAYRAPVGLDGLIECNCSHCEAKGFILGFVPREQFELLSGEGQLTEYQFNKKTLSHQFCSVCGVQPFAFGTGPDGKEMAAINVRTLKDLDIASLSPAPFDGKSY